MSLNKKSLVVIERLRDVPGMSSNSLEQLFTEINDSVNIFRSNGMKNITVIFDDLTFFTNIGCTERELIKMSMKLHDLTKNHNDLSIILKIGLADLHQYLTNNLEDLSDVCITVEKLKSGDFWDVDGKLKIKKVKCENGIFLTESERNVLYYIGDHNVKIIAPGEHGLKI